MYSEPLKTANQKLTPNILVAATPYAILNRVNAGARMSLFNYNDKIIVWSAIPYGDAFDKCLKELTGKEDNKVDYAFVPNFQHTVGLKSLKEKFPDVKIIAVEPFQSEAYNVDYKIPNSSANTLFGGEKWKTIGINDDAFINNLAVVFLKNHKNKDIVIYDKTAKTLFAADFVISFDSTVPQEQYSEATGWTKGRNPFTGWSFILRWFYPGAWYWTSRVNALNATDLEEARKAIRTIYNLDFEKLVPCHGNIHQNGKEAIVKFFPFVEEK